MKLLVKNQCVSISLSKIKILCLQRETLVGALPLAAWRSLMCFS